jgi:fatty acid desaturase
VLVGVAYSVELPWWGRGLLAAAMCCLSFFCAVITHNTVHTPVFAHGAMNRLFQVVLSLTYGHPVSMYVPGHNLSHHAFVQTPKDRMRTDKMRLRWNLLNQLFFFFAVAGPILRDNAEYAALTKVTRPAWYRQLVLETAVYVAFLGAMLALSLRIDGLVPWHFLLFVVLPHQYAAWGITSINFVQHDGTDSDHPYNHSRNLTGKLVNWFTFNNGYHGIHHEHPGLHWSLAPAAHEKEYGPHIDPRLEQRSLLLFLWRQYIWPGKRLRFDGAPVVLPPPRPDESWIASTPSLQIVDLDAGAVNDDDARGAHAPPAAWRAGAPCRPA